MARKRSSSFEDVVVALSRQPWWASLLIGFVSWLILNPVANRPVVVPAGVQIHDMSGVMLSQLWQTFAMFGQYLIPLVCVFGAIGSVFGRQRRKKLHAIITNDLELFKLMQLKRSSLCVKR